jgi:hypothetical protein
MVSFGTHMNVEDNGGFRCALSLPAADLSSPNGGERRY